MADAFRQGQKLSGISATDLNQLQADARSRLGYGNSASANSNFPPLRGNNVVVHGVNDTGMTLSTGDIIEIKGLANGYNESWMVNSVYNFGRPAISDNIVSRIMPLSDEDDEGDDEEEKEDEEPEWPRQIGIIVDEQPVRNGGIAHAAISGAAYAKVNIGDQDDKFANPIDGSTGSLQSAKNGLFRILGKALDSNGDTVNCSVSWSTSPPTPKDDGGDDGGGGGGEDPGPIATVSVTLGRVVSFQTGDDAGQAIIQPVFVDADGSVTDISDPVTAFIFTSF